MGNSASKKAKVEAEKNYAEANSSLAVREQELARTKEALETSRKNEDQFAREAATLRMKLVELDGLSKSLEQERQKHVTKLEQEVKVKGDEIFAQKRVIDSRTQERDEARRSREQMEVKVKTAELSSQSSTADFERERKELADIARRRQNELENAKTESTALIEKINLLTERQEVLGTELEAAKLLAQEKLDAARAAAANELTAAKADAAKELASAQVAMSESARNLSSVSSELTNTKAALSGTTAKLDALQRTHNESVSRRAASHEAFTATKQELAEAQQKYFDTQQKHEMLQLAHDKLGLAVEGATKELRDEREVNDRLKAEVATLKKRLTEGVVRKMVPEIHVQEVDVSA